MWKALWCAPAPLYCVGFYPLPLIFPRRSRGFWGRAQKKIPPKKFGPPQKKICPGSPPKNSGPKKGVFPPGAVFKTFRGFFVFSGAQKKGSPYILPPNLERVSGFFPQKGDKIPGPRGNFPHIRAFYRFKGQYCVNFWEKIVGGFSLNHPGRYPFLKGFDKINNPFYRIS